MQQLQISTTPPRRRRARLTLELGAIALLAAIAAWSGSMVKRSVSAPPAAAIERIVTLDRSDSFDAATFDAVAASNEPGLVDSVDRSTASPTNTRTLDLPADLPEELRFRLIELRQRGAITGDVRVETVEPQTGVVRYFDGRPVRPARKLWMTVTAYSPDERSCGIWADGITASNKSVWTNAMQLVAADTRILPFGTLLSLDDYADGEIVPVLDRGGAIKGMRLDVLYATHNEALQFGVKRVPVTIWEYVD